MTPAQFLEVTVGISAFAYAAELFVRRRSIDVLRRLAGEWRMNFSLSDRLNLTGKVARRFPIPGAANLRVTNVIYGSERDRYRYVFTAEFTVGVVRAKRRITRAGAFSESRDPEQVSGHESVLLAEPKLSLIDQYRSLGPRQGQGTDPSV